MLAVLYPVTEKNLFQCVLLMLMQTIILWIMAAAYTSMNVQWKNSRLLIILLLHSTTMHLIFIIMAGLLLSV